MNPITNNNSNKQILSMITKTWCRDSHGLYDYESSQIKIANINLDESAHIFRKKLDIKAFKTMDEGKEEEYLLDVKNDNCEKISIANSITYSMQPTEKNINELQNKIWYVLKHEESGTNPNPQNFVNTNDDYYICLNDIIKLGRVKYAANEINIQKRIEDSTKQELSSYNISSINSDTKPVFDFIFKTFTPAADIVNEMTCKYCLAGSSDVSNPLVTLCKCTGGLMYSHYLCVKQWMGTKLQKKENGNKTVTSYNIKQFNCEICKTPYPFRFVAFDNPDTIYDLIDIVRPSNQDYIILESLNQLKDNNNIKSIHVILLNEQKITLGRGHESDVRINDISVSRAHASILFSTDTGKICIRDLKSKFGTLVLIKNNILIKNKKIHLQIGRTYLETLSISQKEYNEKKKQRELKKILTSKKGTVKPEKTSQKQSYHGISSDILNLDSGRFFLNQPNMEFELNNNEGLHPENYLNQFNELDVIRKNILDKYLNQDFNNKNVLDKNNKKK